MNGDGTSEITYLAVRILSASKGERRIAIQSRREEHRYVSLPLQGEGQGGGWGYSLGNVSMRG